jgi:DNA repair exonuclease SbcCD nuclease subunit
VATLAGKGSDYWALGHVHRREVLCEEPWIVFPGNLQGRHAKETGPKGATLVTVEEGRVAAVEARALDVVRWAVIAVDAREAATLDAVVERARAALQAAIAEAEGRLVAARVTVEGASAAHPALESDPARLEGELRAAANEIGGAWIERVRVRTRTQLDLPELAKRDDPIGQLLRALAALRGDEAQLRALGDEFGELAAKLPPELREGDDALRLDDPAALRALVDDVEQLLVPRLLGRERPA